MVESYTLFKGVRNIGDTLIMNELENNLKTFLDWGFLNIGGFVNVQIPTSGSFGGNFHTLRVAEDPSYTDGTVWETIRKDWVWETGVNFNGMSPIAISGVYINGVLYAPNDATYGHHYDYANGRVVFNSAVSAASAVTMNYSYRWVQISLANNANWFYEGQYDSLLPGDPQWTTYHPGSGDFSSPPQHRIQFPAIIIEAVPRARNRPYEVGNTSLWVEQDVVFNIIAENKWGRNKLVDVIRLEDNREIYLYDSDRVARSGFNAIDYRGMLVNTSGMYPYLVDNFRLAKVYFKEVVLAETESLNPKLHEASVRVTMELVLKHL